MPQINNSVTIIKKWLDEGGFLSKLLEDYNTNQGSLNAIIKESSNKIKGNVVDDFNTLEKIATILDNNPNLIKEILDALKNKVEKDGNKGLTDYNFSYNDKNKLDNLVGFDNHYIINMNADEIHGINSILNKISESVPFTYDSKLYRITVRINYDFPMICDSVLFESYEQDASCFTLITTIPDGYLNFYHKSYLGEWERIKFDNNDIIIDKLKEIIYKDNNKTIVLNGDVALFKGIDIKGYTELNENIVKYPRSIDSISVNGKKINNESIEVDNLYSIDEDTYDSLNCSFDKITNIQKVKHIYLPEEGIEGENNTDKRAWVYSGMQSTKDYNLFYINLNYSHINGDEKPILSTKEYSNLYVSNFAKGYWKEGTTFKELKYTGTTKTLEDRTFFFQDKNTPRLWFVSRQGEGYSNINVGTNNNNPKIPIELFFEKQMTEIDVTDKYSELWECIKNNGAGQKVEIKDNYSHLLENEIQYGDLISNNSGDSSSEEIEAIKTTLNNKANKENAFDYYIEINQDGIFEYDRYTNSGTYLLCQKTDEDYGNPPWQYYKLLTVVDGDPDYLIQTEYDLSYGVCRKRDNYDEEISAGGNWKPWVNVFASKNDLDNKVSKVDGMGLSTNDFTNEEKETLKHINYCNISEDWAYVTENAILEILQNENYKEGINIVRATFEYGFLLVSFSDYFQAFFISTEGRIYFFQDKSIGNGKWQLMGEVYASTKYVDDAIGDVETALENIIAKYGLGNSQS